ncbi:hypothetical protein [Tenacibaculum agarivorans]|uniref:hypothetical protein n=1 Tax=Tenacibaculum agarivorans TaxID=1908389 RepID=UPI00094B798C|nr:hypothetical protein [Tenacibaculum agarivorans]
MILEKIKEKLNKEGYQIIMRPLKGTDNCIQGGIPKKNKNASLNTFFRIIIPGDKLYLDFMSQRETNKYFDSEKDLIAFIKQKFPIE